MVLSGTNQDALQAIFGDDVTACFGKRVLLEPTPMRVAGRDLVVIRLKAAPSSNGTAPKAAPGERGMPEAADSPHPESMASG